MRWKKSIWMNIYIERNQYWWTFTVKEINIDEHLQWKKSIWMNVHIERNQYWWTFTNDNDVCKVCESMLLEWNN